ncbi:MAG: ATP-binding protein [Patescibacteria group bacterium]
MEDQIRESLLRQKSERDILLSKEYIVRDHVPFAGGKRSRSLGGESKELESNEIIKVILGPRRSGKSVYGISVFKDKDFIYINFDDQGLAQENNHNILYMLINMIYHNRRGSRSKNIFLDEIQNLPQWELFVSILYRQGYNIIITGSNSKLLSKELSSRLTGRYVEDKIFPFSFKEYLSFYLKKTYGEIDKLLVNKVQNNSYGEDIFRIIDLLEEYLEKGGYPITVTTDIDYRNYLDTLFNSVIFEDIVKRYDIRSGLLLSNLAKYLLSLFSKEYSYTKLKNVLGFKNVNTVKSYVGYLEEAFLIFSLSKYSTKFKEQINSSKKTYVVDNGFISAFYIQGVDLKSRLLENQVFIQLLRQNKVPNYTMFYYKTKNNKEVDFIIKDDLSNKIVQLIQVSYSIDNIDTKKREISALVEASDELECDNCTIITWNDNTIIKNGEKTINCIPLWVFLLNTSILSKIFSTDRENFIGVSKEVNGILKDYTGDSSKRKSLSNSLGKWDK